MVFSVKSKKERGRALRTERETGNTDVCKEERGKWVRIFVELLNKEGGPFFLLDHRDFFGSL